LIFFAAALVGYVYRPCKTARDWLLYAIPVPLMIFMLGCHWQPIGNRRRQYKEHGRPYNLAYRLAKIHALHISKHQFTNAT